MSSEGDDPVPIPPDCLRGRFWGPQGITWRLFHLPTSTVADGRTPQEADETLKRKLAERGVTGAGSPQ